MDAVSLLRAEDLAQAADALEEGVRHSTSSGWEWLGVLGHAAQSVLQRYPLAPATKAALQAILRTTRSKTPYG
jgi:hypothetical protein